jgi:hypothetical protein
MPKDYQSRGKPQSTLDHPCFQLSACLLPFMINNNWAYTIYQNDITEIFCDYGNAIKLALNRVKWSDFFKIIMKL